MARTGRFFFALMAALAEMEHGIVSERTKAALDHIRNQGKVYGPAQYGFQRDGDSWRDSVPAIDKKRFATEPTLRNAKVFL
ncbi:MAG: recombinase family protein [Syntrophobacteraceae bacterium]